MRQRVARRPMHAAPACGVSWCRDPQCGPEPAPMRESYLSILASSLQSKQDPEGTASRPRRMATRFGLLLFAGLVGMASVVAGPAAAELVLGHLTQY